MFDFHAIPHFLPAFPLVVGVLLLAVTFLGVGVCLIILVGVGVGRNECGVCRGFN